MTPENAREALVRALRLDLIGPDDDDPLDAALREEKLRVRPTRAYLTGFLVAAARTSNGSAQTSGSDDEDEDLSDETADEQLDSPSPEGDENETAAAERPRFPSSIGLSVLVHPAEKRLEARVTCATYERITIPITDSDDEPSEPGVQPKTRFLWKRCAHDIPVSIDLVDDGALHPHPAGLDGLTIDVVTRPFADAGRSLLGDGTRAVTLFLVNRRDPTKAGGKDGATVFQARLHVQATNGFLPRPNPRGTQATDPHDERVADLLYRNDGEHAIGHGISVMAKRRGEGPNEFVANVATSWLPSALVPRTVANEKIENVQFGMEALADLPPDDYEAMRRSLLPMVKAYRDWIEAQRSEAEAALREIGVADVREARLGTTRRLLDEAELAARRVEHGIDLLSEPTTREAFQLANRAMALQMWQRDGDRLRKDGKVPAWRPFQLAFVLLSLPGIVEPESDERAIVDLIFFPTGGGKTEAYLGLAAFTLLLRRLRLPDAAGGGVAVLMRYTLRLLTLDQLSRAATLVCALEKMRRAAPEKLGSVRFSIGLWVGRGATPNKFGAEHGNEQGTAIQRVFSYKSGRGPLPFPLERCPWCSTPFVQDSFEIKPNRTAPKQLRVLCFGRGCEFRWSKTHPHGIPVVVVDDEIYRELPPFLIATVDKLAGLPWVYRTAFLFGRHVTHHHAEWGYFGGGEIPDGFDAKPLPRPLDPPDLVIQDELHLVSGPLGTMVGLYETAIARLAERSHDGKKIGPKIVASTATVRRADAQIRGLFCREDVRVFPPPGPDRKTSFFAQVKDERIDPSRLYLGVTAPGRSQKAMLMRSYTALLAAAARLFRDAPEAADPYMTLVGYFNSLRELGGSRRIVEDEVRARLGRAGQERREDDERLFADRRNIRVVEITSRLTTDEVRTFYNELRLVHEPRTEVAKKPRDAKRGPRPVDVALATNMISVGLDVSRLGLMVVCGQPKTTAEYIQATSRVGRDPNRPGLVVTLLNGYRARDRSHLEHFPGYHASFYRAVEATSVTPFAPRAIDRGLAGVTVALARLLDRRLLRQDDAARIAEARADLGFVADVITARAAAHVAPEHALPPEALQDLRRRVETLLDAWARVAADDPGAVGLAYQPYEPPSKSKRFLLRMPIDPDLKSATADARRFVANRSLRDVEGVTAVHVVDLPPIPSAPESDKEPAQ
ncbi:MAG: DISARM system helicase DrmA [Polyangiaceae bacterium]